jgi:hypothetical protein
VDGLLALTNDITEPAPNWSSGDRIINVLRFNYIRDYLPEEGQFLLGEESVKPSNFQDVAMKYKRIRKSNGPVNPDGDGIAEREIIVEFRDTLSVERNGEQVLEIDALAFRAVGLPTGEPLGEGLPEDIENEQGHYLARQRQLHVHNRYSLGAPVMTVDVRRDATLSLRAGSWVMIDLTWFPDYVTRFRGLVSLGQVIALGDLDCRWRRVTMEVVTPLTLPGS